MVWRLLRHTSPGSAANSPEPLGIFTRWTREGAAENPPRSSPGAGGLRPDPQPPPGHLLAPRNSNLASSDSGGCGSFFGEQVKHILSRSVGPSPSPPKLKKKEKEKVARMFLTSDGEVEGPLEYVAKTMQELPFLKRQRGERKWR